MNNILCNYFYIMDQENKIIAENSNFLYFGKKAFFLVFLFLFIILSFSCSNTIFQNKNIDFEISLTLPSSVENKDETKFVGRASEGEDWNIKAWIENEDKILQTIKQKGANGQKVVLRFENIIVGQKIRLCVEIAAKEEKTPSYIGVSEWIIIQNGVNKLNLNLQKNESILNAKEPNITSHPEGKVKVATDTDGEESFTKELNVEAHSIDDGIISYQWEEKNNDVWQVVQGETQNFISVTVAKGESKTFRCVVTNTNNEVNGKKTSTLASNAATVAYVEGTLNSISAEYTGTYELFGKDFTYENITVTETYKSDAGNIDIEVVASSSRYLISVNETVGIGIGNVPYTITHGESKLTSPVLVPVKFSLPTDGFQIIGDSSGTTESGSEENPDLIAQHIGELELSVLIKNAETTPIPTLYFDSEGQTSNYNLMEQGVDISWKKDSTTINTTDSSVTVNNAVVGDDTYTITLTPKSGQEWCIGEKVSVSYYVKVCPWQIEITQDGSTNIDVTNLSGGTSYNLVATNDAMDNADISWVTNNDEFTISDSLLQTPDASFSTDKKATIKAMVGEKEVATLDVTVKKQQPHITYAGYDNESGNSVFYIYDAEGLKKFRDIVNGVLYDISIPGEPSVSEYFVENTHQKIKGVLQDNIELDSEWTPMGTSEKQFIGAFDGNNKTISGLSITEFPSQKVGTFCVGLFGYIGNGTNENIEIKNLVLEGSVVLNAETEQQACSIGGFAGYANKVLFKNCVNNVTIDFVNYGYSYIGGIVGTFNGCEIQNCINLADISAAEYLGGIAGTSGSLSDIPVEPSSFNKCINIGNITVTYNAGGIVGYDNSDVLNVSNCLNLGSIGNEEQNGMYLGGIIGYGEDEPNTVDCCISAGKLLGSTLLYAIDSTNNSTTYTNNYYDAGITNVELKDYVTCSSLTTEQLTDGTLFCDKFQENWSFSSGRYPLPNVQGEIPASIWQFIETAAIPE